MVIDIRRTDKNPKRIIGLLYVDDTNYAYTLERTDVAIPAGQYKVTITHSNRFNKLLPLINNVPHRSGIRIHSGNKAADTEGCVLVGLNRMTDIITESRLAMDTIMPKLQKALDRGEDVLLTIG